MPTARKNGVRTATPAAPAPKAAPAAGPAGPDQNTLLLAALAVQDGGTVEISFAAYGEVLACKDDLAGVKLEKIPGVGVRVTAEWISEQEDDTADVVAAQEVVKEAYRPTPAAPAPAAPAAPKVGPAVDRPSLARPAETFPVKDEAKDYITTGTKL